MDGQAALDPRIRLSIPIAGSIPCHFSHTSIDFEQFCERPYNRVCDYECQYVLAGLEKERYSVQVIHEFDPCCFQCDYDSAATHDLSTHTNGMIIL